MLVKHVENVNIKDYKKRTPLYFAILNEKTECVRILLEHKGDYEIPDINGFKPYEKCNNSEINALILLHSKHS